jgi:hypothetical protein
VPEAKHANRLPWTSTRHAQGHHATPGGIFGLETARLLVSGGGAAAPGPWVAKQLPCLGFSGSVHFSTTGRRAGGNQVSDIPWWDLRNNHTGPRALRANERCSAACPSGRGVCIRGGTQAQCRAIPPLHSAPRARQGGSLALTAVGRARPGSICLVVICRSGLTAVITADQRHLGHQIPRAPC